MHLVMAGGQLSQNAPFLSLSGMTAETGMTAEVVVHSCMIVSCDLALPLPRAKQPQGHI